MVFQLVQLKKLTGEHTCWRNSSRLIEDTFDQSDKSENQNDDEEDIIDMNTVMHYVKALRQYAISKEFLSILLEVCGLKQML